jgi:hypothetical protein
VLDVVAAHDRDARLAVGGSISTSRRRFLPYQIAPPASEAARKPGDRGDEQEDDAERDGEARSPARSGMRRIGLRRVPEVERAADVVEQRSSSRASPRGSATVASRLRRRACRARRGHRAALRGCLRAAVSSPSTAATSWISLVRFISGPRHRCA